MLRYIAVFTSVCTICALSQHLNSSANTFSTTISIDRRAINAHTYTRTHSSIQLAHKQTFVYSMDAHLGVLTAQPNIYWFIMLR